MDPNEIARYWLPNNPSVSIVATESCLMISCVDFARSMITVTFSPGWCGNIDLAHRSTVHAAYSHIASRIQASHIVELRLQLVRRAEKILLAPDDEDSDHQNCQVSTTMKAPSRAALDIVPSYECFRNALTNSMSLL